MFRCVESEIWECVHRASGLRFCVKTISAQDSAVWHEIHLLEAVQGHSKIVQLVDVMESGDKAHVVMELLTGGNVLSRVAQAGSMSEDVVCGMARDLLQALQYLHTEHSILHNDVQPGNVLMDCSGVVKLVDFGSATDMMQQSKSRPHRINMAYSAPEVLLGAAPTYSSDLWSCGAVVYYCLFGRPPFNDASTGRPVLSKIQRGEYSFPPEVSVSRKAKQFISSLLHLDPAVRLTAAEALDHSWLEGSKRLNSKAVMGTTESASSGTPLKSSSVRTLARQLMCSPFRRRQRWKDTGSVSCSSLLHDTS